MKRILTFGLLLLAIACRPAPKAPAAKASFPIAESHRVLASPSDWLNTARPLKAEDLAGRILLVDFWTYACINCIHVMPDLHRLEKEFGKDLAVIGVHSAKFDNEKDSDNIRAAVLRYELSHPVVNDADFKVWNAFGVNAWPTWILIKPDGEVDRTYSGEGNYDEVRADVERLRQEFAGKLRQDPLPLSPEKAKMAPSELSFPGKLAFDVERGLLWISDSNHHRLVAIKLDGTVVETVGKKGEAGKQDGDFATARFHRPQGLLYGPGKLYVADTENHLIRVVDLAQREVKTIAGTGVQGFLRELQNAPALTTPLSSPWDLAFFPDAGSLAIAMAGTHQLWSLDLARGALSVLAGNGRESIDDGPYPENSLSQPSGLSAVERRLYFVDSETSSLRLLFDQAVKTLIGTGLFDFGFKDGDAKTARLQHPIGLWAEEGRVYIADTYNHSIRLYDMKAARLSTLAGDGRRGEADGPFAAARFNEPNAILRIGEKLYVADTNNHRIRALDPLSGQVSTLELKSKEVPAAASATSRPAENLPNRKISQDLTLAPGGKIEWKLELPQGWKLNAQAPSRLQLFAVDGEPRALASFGKEELAAKRVTLPALEAGGKYLLQGLLYYCREGAEALCYLGGAEARVQVKDGGANLILWKLDP
ncbi:MAG TPA: thioredoxin-like domain-containing protein [bacterium]|nr:thioredoxin-like domain-containing protein [bacterium]